MRTLNYGSGKQKEIDAIVFLEVLKLPGYLNP